MAKTPTSPLFGPRAKGQAHGIKPMPAELVEKVDQRVWPFLVPGRGKTPGRGRVFKGP
jgi:hypothetical protein